MYRQAFTFIIATALIALASCNKQITSTETPVKVEGPWMYISQSDLFEMGLNNVDATMPFVRLGEDDYWIYLSEGGKTDGKHSNIFRVRTTVSEIDKDTIERVPIAGIPDADVNDYNGWKAWMMNLYEIDEDEWLAVLHYEDQDENFKEDFRMGIAYSNDDGASFEHLGFTLETALPAETIKRGNCTGKINIAGTGLRWDDTHLYVYFSDMHSEDRTDRHIAVARADKAEVIRNARLGKNTQWFKYHNGAWNEPGRGGYSSDVGRLGEYHTTIAYNPLIEKWLIFNVTSGAITLRKSADPLDFHAEDETLFKFDVPAGYRVAYCSILPDQADRLNCGREFYVYFRYMLKQSGSGTFDIHRIKVTL